MFYLLDWGAHHREIVEGPSLEEALEDKGYAPKAQKFLDSYQPISIPAVGWEPNRVKDLMGGIVIIYTHPHCPDVEKWVGPDIPRVEYYPTHLI